jgi:hypothetical protein
MFYFVGNHFELDFMPFHVTFKSLFYVVSFIWFFVNLHPPSMIL